MREFMLVFYFIGNETCLAMSWLKDSNVLGIVLCVCINYSWESSVCQWNKYMLVEGIEACRFWWRVETFHFDKSCEDHKESKSRMAQRKIILLISHPSHGLVLQEPSNLHLHHSFKIFLLLPIYHHWPLSLCVCHKHFEISAVLFTSFDYAQTVTDYQKP